MMGYQLNPFTRNLDATGGTPSVAQARQESQVTLPALANSATGTESIALAKSCLIISVETNKAGWVRIYSSVANRTADSGRDRANDPGVEAGLVAEVIHAGSDVTTPSIPSVASNAEDPVTTSFAVSAVNDGTTGDYIITVTYLPLES